MISFRASAQPNNTNNSRNNVPSNLGNGHIETLVPYLFRPTKTQPYERERIDTPDNDFLDLDWLKNGNSNFDLNPNIAFPLVRYQDTQMQCLYRGFNWLKCFV